MQSNHSTNPHNGANKFNPLLLKLMLISLLWFHASAYSEERVIERNIQAASDVQIHVDSNSENLIIRTDDIDAVRITVVLTDHSRDALYNVDLITEVADNQVRIAIDYKKDAIGFGGLFFLNGVKYPDVQLQLTVPVNSSLVLNAHRTRFDVIAPSGEVSLNSYRGEGIISHISNNLSITTFRDDLKFEIAQLHDLIIENRRGDLIIELDNAYDFTLQTNSGSRNLEIYGRDIDISPARRGEIFTLEEGAGVNLINIESNGGKVRLDFKNQQ